MKGLTSKISSPDDNEGILFNEQVGFPRLEQLEIESMQNLMKIWDDQLNLDAICKLKSLSVNDCGKLVYIFSLNILKRLHWLERLTVADCPLLEEILGSLEHSANQLQDSLATQTPLDDSEVEHGFVFSKLEFLKLFGLERLKGFCTLKCRIYFPSLVNALVMSCPRMQYFSTGELITPKLRNVYSNEPCAKSRWKDDLNSTIKEMFTEKVGYSSLSSLSFARLPELVTIWNEKPQETLNFKILTFLEVCNLNGSSYLLTSSMALDLVQLNELKIISCDSMEQVIAGKVSEGPLFPKLERLWVENLPKLTSFCSGKSIELACLQHILLSRCPLFETFITSSGDMMDSEHKYRPPLFDAKVTFPRIEGLKIEFMDSLEKIWDDEFVADAFCQLKYLTVILCRKLLNIFSFGILKKLHQLELLTVANCLSLETIVRSPEASSPIQSQDPISCQLALVGAESIDRIVLGKLKLLRLSFLERLKSFCSFNKCGIELPSLEKAVVMGCPRMQLFSVGESIVPKLERVHWTYDTDEGSWKNDLNTTIQEMFANKVGYSSFEFLYLEEFPELIMIWDIEPQKILNFRIIAKLEICRINSLRCLLTPSMALELVQLNYLKIINCDAMEQVIIGEVSEGTLFPKLEKLWLEDLPKLTDFCVGNSIELSRLQGIRLGRCPLLKTFVSRSAVGHTMASTEQAKDTSAVPHFTAKATFPELIALGMDWVDFNMWRGEYLMEHFPKLGIIYLFNFPEQSAEIPFSFFQSIPRLEKLVVNGVSCEIGQKHGAKHSNEDTKSGLQGTGNYETGECSQNRSANVLEESSVFEGEKVDGSEDGSKDVLDAKDEADESESNGNDMKESDSLNFEDD